MAKLNANEQQTTDILEELDKTITKNDLHRAMEVLQEYKQGKANLENRIKNNEQWFKLRHWDFVPRTEYNINDPRPVSPWLFNSIINKHADAMDNFPEPNVLPREEGDKQDAQALSEILPVILDNNDFESTYSDVWWYKLKTGTGVYGVFWNSNLNNGLGDIDIKKVDILNLFWQPGIKDIQDSTNLFCVDLIDNEVLEQQYPETKGRLGHNNGLVKEYITDDAIDTSKKSCVIDWYYKKKQEYTDINGLTLSKDVLHYVKFVDDVLLYSSENDPNYKQRGFYDHAKYPFVFDKMFATENTPAGFGYIDTMKDEQMYIDKFWQLIIMNAFLASKPRYFVNKNGGMNLDEFADWSKTFVEIEGKLSDDNIKKIEVEKLDTTMLNLLQLKIDELKETSGNRDFSQGSTASGVTAASAIAALQEAGNKLSRDMIKASYRCYVQICQFIIELIKQFYDTPRCFRIVGKQGDYNFISYSNENIKNDDLGRGRVVFDINVKSQKASPFSKVAQNETAKEMYQLGMFNPDMADSSLIAIDMMDFEGKDSVVEKVIQHQQMAEQMEKMNAIIEQLYPQGNNMLGGGMEQ